MNSFHLKSLQSISSSASTSDSSQFTTSPMSGRGSTEPGSETRRPGVPSRTDPGPGPGGLGHPGDPGDSPQQQQQLLPFLDSLLPPPSWPCPWPRARPRPPPLEGGFLATQRLGIAPVDPVISLTLPPQLLQACNTNRKWWRERGDTLAAKEGGASRWRSDQRLSPDGSGLIWFFTQSRRKINTAFKRLKSVYACVYWSPAGQIFIKNHFILMICPV